MSWKTFVLGSILALLVLLMAQQPAEDTSAPSGTALVDLTYGNVVQPAAPPLRSQAVPPRRIVAPLVVLDVSAKVAAHRDYLVSLDDIAHWEEAHGQIPPDAVVLARTSLPADWNAERSAAAGGHYPGYSADAVHFLVEGRGVYGLGTDTPDRGRSLVLPYRGNR